MTSTTITRRCASAVVCSRSIASVANATAVSNPKQFVVPTMSLSIVFGTPMMGIPSFEKRCAIASVPSPPMTTRAPNWSRSNISTTRSLYCRTPSEVWIVLTNGSPVLTVPRMVPPRRRMPVTSFGVSERDRLNSRSPSKLSSMPTTSAPALDPAFTTARITAFRPGASPPPVRTPIFLTE